MQKKVSNILPAYGYLTFASFIICALTGILLTFTYDPAKPVESIGLILLNNPAAALIRSLHYWSAQIFLILAIVHIADHLIKSRELKLKNIVWLRTVLSIPAILYVMLSGFFLRGDNESNQAIQILDSIIKSIPLIGDVLSYFFIGNEDTFLIIFLNHIVTATLIIWLFSAEHSKVIYSNRKSYLWIVPLLFILAVLFVPELQKPSETIIKSPWYFIVLQEFLHQVNIPVVTILLFILFLAIVYFLPNMRSRRRLSGIILIILTSTYLIFSIVGLFFRGEYWNWGSDIRNFTSQLNYFNFFNYFDIPESLQDKMIKGKPEGCLSCHIDVAGFSDAHSPDSIGCSSCHLGNPFTLNKELAHQGIILVAGNLSNSRRTCGSQGCHVGMTERVESNIMNTMSGVIAVDKWIFGEIKNLDHHFAVQNLGHSPADKHLRALCAGCHIGKDKSKPMPIDELSRGGGCTACHLHYSNEARDELNQWEKDRSRLTKFHPKISVKVTNDACFGCHSRSGRISTNYEGWHETLYSEADYHNFKNKTGFRLLKDGRVFIKIKEDVHHSAGLECIDCHSSYELMGNGIKYKHKEEQVKIECVDCHFATKPKTIQYDEMDNESRKIITLRKLFKEGRKFVLQSRSMMPLVNVYIADDGSSLMRSKNNDSVYSPKKLLPECGSNIPGHKRLSCRACHTQWAPQCISCHTQYIGNQPGWDNLTNKETIGAWQETPMDFRADAPALGVLSKSDHNGRNSEEIGTFVPGMIMTLQQSTSAKSSFHRLYAPAFAHTITRESRTCKSCHSDPYALGYGRGKLVFSVNKGKGALSFVADYPRSKYDNLPEDAWIPFLGYRKNAATRQFARPFTIAEQKKILTIGACLNCHDHQEARLVKLFKNFDNFKSKLSKKCILPFE